jgi:hypothetical protein
MTLTSKNSSTRSLRIAFVCGLAILALTGCVRVHLAQRVEQAKASYNSGQFDRVLGYYLDNQGLRATYDPPGNYTIGEIRRLIVKSGSSPDYDYRDIFDKQASSKLSVEAQAYLQQLSLLETRALINQYLQNARPPYGDSQSSPAIEI